jgi:signal transduction histidine kinase
MVLAFDDLTELLKAQRLAAWREVAQRIAHEIKNPLTPIQLSAQRIRRAFLRDDPDFEKVLGECTSAIVNEVDALKNLVDEFAQFARLPAETVYLECRTVQDVWQAIKRLSGSPVPAWMFVDPEGNTILMRRGSRTRVDLFVTYDLYVAGGAYRRMTFEQFLERRGMRED